MEVREAPVNDEDLNSRSFMPIQLDLVCVVLESYSRKVVRTVTWPAVT